MQYMTEAIFSERACARILRSYFEAKDKSFRIKYIVMLEDHYNRRIAIDIDQ